MSKKQRQEARDYIASRKQHGCTTCENFGQIICPSFQKATSEEGLDARILREEISKSQKELELIPCKNVPTDTEPK